jgi:DNA-binding response OmpR family regulator
MMDVQMPKLDGLSAAHQIRASERGGKHLPIIAMTANAMKDDRRRCLDAGMDDYLSKPLKPALLVQTVNRWIPRSEAPAKHPDSDGVRAIEALPVLDMGAIDELASTLPAKRVVPFLRLCLLRADEEAAAIARLDPQSSLAEIQNEAHKLLANAPRTFLMEGKPRLGGKPEQSGGPPRNPIRSRRPRARAASAGRRDRARPRLSD